MSKTTVWKCEVCGYVHQGDSPPEECPVCGVGPEMFEPMEVAAPEAAPPAASVWRCTVCGYEHSGDAPPDECPVCGVGPEMFEPVAEADKHAAAAEAVERIVILGAGIAGVTAAEHARRTAPGARIELVSKESGLPYFRLNLTRMLAGEVSEDSLPLESEDWYREKRIELAFAEVTRIDRDHKQVFTREGGALPYDRLVLANGAHAFVPPIPGAEREGVFRFRSLADTLAIAERTASGSRCACIGGGLLGLEAAGALARRGASVTVLEGFDWLLPRQLAEPAGRLLQRHLEGLGISVRCGVRVKELIGDEAVGGVNLADETTVDADVVVLATGVRPNNYLARQCGIETKSGVLVNDRMETSDAAIFAAGDVAEHRGVVYGIWPAAFAQAAVAGINAAGGDAEFTGLAPSNRLKVLDVDLYSIGQFTAADGSYLVHEDDGAGGGQYRRLVCRDGRVVGANLYGNITLASTIRDAVESGAQLRELSVLLAELPGLRELCGLTD